jgi:hypothetical protein
MPYIKIEDRTKYDQVLKQLPNFETKGDLEYCIFYLMKAYMGNREYKYTELHNTVYAAVHCGDEFRRRFLDKREDEAIETNGDV